MPRKTVTPPLPSSPTTNCFNEAAARCRGKRQSGAGHKGGERCFNEAAARCRGKPQSARNRRDTRRGFNEAAARCRGKRTPASRRLLGLAALQ